MIYIDRRNRRYYGKRAYDFQTYEPDNTAARFKRLIGTATPIRMRDAKLTLSPEECSAEILRLLFGYLPEEVRNNESTATVVTVPAAFDQMQKDATLSAATLAGIGRIALMQEPVAAVMSVMRTRKSDGIFAILGMGRGT